MSYIYIIFYVLQKFFFPPNGHPISFQNDQ